MVSLCGRSCEVQKIDWKFRACRLAQGEASCEYTLASMASILVSTGCLADN